MGTLSAKSRISEASAPTFIDLFAGCGGLSLGLMQAGWHGLFAIEKDPSAFETLSTNLIEDGTPYHFDWPSWFPKEAVDASDALGRYSDQLYQLAGSVDLVVGGPPCQGFSSAGRRDPKDPRNKLMDTYVHFVEAIRPKFVLVENVRGMTLEFNDSEGDGNRVNYAKKLLNALSERYVVNAQMLDLSSFGVPQARSRFFIFGIRKDLVQPANMPLDPFVHLESERMAFLRSKGLTAPMSAKAALSDLEIKRNGVTESTEMKGFQQIKYISPITPFQKLLRTHSNGPPKDVRVANHRADIVKRFQEIIELCHATGRLNVSLARDTREAYGLKKQAIRVLDPDRPAPTVTSLPDDMLHYSEPRILTVRETARLQSFPDWFRFCGQYTTGGVRRRTQVPRYTQVANAVPPLAAEAIGHCLRAYLSSCADSKVLLDSSSKSSSINAIASSN